MKLEQILKLSPSQIIEAQKTAYSQNLILIDSVPAGQTKQGILSIGSYGHFFLNYITGTFETINAGSDTGVCYLYGKLVDNAVNRDLFNDYIPLNLFCSPGRRASTKASGSPSNAIYSPEKFEYFFSANTDIAFSVKNSSDTELSYELCFHGIRVKGNK